MQPKILTPDGDCLIYEYTRMKSPEHLHAMVEIIAPSEGTLQVMLDGSRLDVMPGQVVVIFPGTPHRYPSGEACRGIAILFLPELLSGQGWDFTTLRPASPILELSKLDADVGYCLKRLGEMAASKTNIELASAYLSLLFLRILPALRPEECSVPTMGDLLYRAMQYISQNIAAPLSIRGVAHELGVNTYYLSRILNRKLHMNFREYLNALRIERAKKLLRATSRSIEDIAAACGFSNLRTFDRVFSEACAVTPRDFRKASKVTAEEKK